MLSFHEGSPHPILHQFEDAVLYKHDCNIMLRDSVFLKWAKVRVDSFQSGFDSMPTLIVHADTDQDFDAFKVESILFPTFSELAQIVDEPISGLEIVDFTLLGSVIVDDFGAVGGSDSGKVLTERSSAVCYYESFVEARTAEDVEG